MRGDALRACVFAGKTTLSGLLALLVAFTFNLDDPQWTLLTVFIVSQPQRDGLVFAKSFFRIIGTLIGAVMSLTLVGLAAQERVLFLGALSIWIGLCAFASTYVRGWAAYGFVLSGYTAAIVGVPGALVPGSAFYIAVARVTEIIIGIVVTATVARVILPDSFGKIARLSIADLQKSVSDCVAAVLRGDDRPDTRARLLSKAAALEEMRYSAIFADEAIRRARNRIANLTGAAIRVLGSIECLANGAQTLRLTAGRGVSDFVCVLDRATRGIAAWQAGELAACDLRLRLQALHRQLLLSLHPACPVLGDLDPAQAMVATRQLKEVFDALGGFAQALDRATEENAPPGPDLALTRPTDTITAAATGLRAALGVALASLFWILTAWPHGSTATVLAAVATARLATMGHQIPLAIAGALIFAVAAVPSFIVIETILPFASGFAMFALAVAPMLFLCALLMAFERTMIIGYLSALLFASVGAFQNRMDYDPVALINTTIAAIVAVGIALVLWAVLMPDTPYSVRRRFKVAARAAFSRGADSLERFDSEMGGALILIGPRILPPQPAAAEILDAALTLFAGGRTLALAAEEMEPARAERAGGRVREAVSACLAEIGRLSLDPARLRASVAALRSSRYELAIARVLVSRNSEPKGLADAA